MHKTLEEALLGMFSPVHKMLLRCRKINYFKVGAFYFFHECVDDLW